MDDRIAYMLNALWTRHFDLGRVVRFRAVQRGDQAESFEVLTAEQREFTLYLYPASFEEHRLARAAEALAAFDRERFSIVPMVKTREGRWLAEGPQGTRMMVGLRTDGQSLPAADWSAHDISQLGLRLGWLHRLAEQQLHAPSGPSLHDELSTALALPPQEAGPRVRSLPAAALARLLDAVQSLEPDGWAHGQVQAGAFLMDHDHQIRTVVDWGLLHEGDPLEDLIDAFFQWCIGPDGLVIPEHARTLIAAYRSLRDFPRTAWRTAVHSWLARRIIHAAHHRRPITNAFIVPLTHPEGLVESIGLCETK